MVDCSHANSGKDPERQPAVATELAAQVAGGDRAIAAVMIESNLLGGAQDYRRRPLVRGRSVTDACLSWEKTGPSSRGWRTRWPQAQEPGTEGALDGPEIQAAGGARVRARQARPRLQGRGETSGAASAGTSPSSDVLLLGPRAAALVPACAVPVVARVLRGLGVEPELALRRCG